MRMEQSAGPEFPELPHSYPEIDGSDSFKSRGGTFHVRWHPQLLRYFYNFCIVCVNKWTKRNTPPL